MNKNHGHFSLLCRCLHAFLVKNAFKRTKSAISERFGSPSGTAIVNQKRPLFSDFVSFFVRLNAFLKILSAWVVSLYAMQQDSGIHDGALDFRDKKRVLLMKVYLYTLVLKPQ